MRNVIPLKGYRLDFVDLGGLWGERSDAVACIVRRRSRRVFRIAAPTSPAVSPVAMTDGPARGGSWE